MHKKYFFSSLTLGFLFETRNAWRYSWLNVIIFSRPQLLGFTSTRIKDNKWKVYPAKPDTTQQDIHYLAFFNIQYFQLLTSCRAMHGDNTFALSKVFPSIERPHSYTNFDRRHFYPLKHLPKIQLRLYSVLSPSRCQNIQPNTSAIQENFPSQRSGPHLLYTRLYRFVSRSEFENSSWVFLDEWL